MAKLRHILALAVLGFLPLSACFAQDSPKSASEQYQLHSWQDPKSGVWNFCILPSSDSEHCTLKGMRALKKRISELARGSVIYWVDKTPGTGSELGAYPPAEIIKQVKQYAAKRHVKVEILSSNPLVPKE